MQRHLLPVCYTLIVCEKNILPNEGTTSRKTLPDINVIFKNRDLRDSTTKLPTPTDVPRVKVQSNNPTQVPRVKLHSDDTPRVPRVQPPAAKQSSKPTIQ